jgi:hypothetical protein
MMSGRSEAAIHLGLFFLPSVSGSSPAGSRGGREGVGGGTEGVVCSSLMVPRITHQILEFY